MAPTVAGGEGLSTQNPALLSHKGDSGDRGKKEEFVGTGHPRANPS